MVDHVASAECRALVESILRACNEDRADDAQAGWEQLQSMGPLPEMAKVIPIYIMLARGDALEALRTLNGMPDDFSPETRVLCLHMVGDPTWHTHALALADHPDPLLREGARQLLLSAQTARRRV
jgi:hypothetical protein